MDFEKDSVLDVNGDGQMDFVYYWHPRNGICQPLYAEVFLVDSINKSFTRIDVFEHIPNPVFHPKKKQASSYLECRDNMECLYKWNNNELEETYSKITSIHD